MKGLFLMSEVPLRAFPRRVTGDSVRQGRSQDVSEDRVPDGPASVGTQVIYVDIRHARDGLTRGII